MGRRGRRGGGGKEAEKGGGGSRDPPQRPASCRRRLTASAPPLGWPTSPAVRTKSRHCPLFPSPYPLIDHSAATAHGDAPSSRLDKQSACRSTAGARGGNPDNDGRPATQWSPLAALAEKAGPPPAAADYLARAQRGPYRSPTLQAWRRQALCSHHDRCLHEQQPLRTRRQGAAVEEQAVY